jgi:hypothetical protein
MYVRIYIYAYVCVCVHCTYVFVFMYGCVLYVGLCSYMCVCVCMYVNMYVCMYVPTYALIYYVCFVCMWFVCVCVRVRACVSRTYVCVHNPSLMGFEKNLPNKYLDLGGRKKEPCRTVRNEVIHRVESSPNIVLSPRRSRGLYGRGLTLRVMQLHPQPSEKYGLPCAAAFHGTHSYGT